MKRGSQKSYTTSKIQAKQKTLNHELHHLTVEATV